MTYSRKFQSFFLLSMIAIAGAQPAIPAHAAELPYSDSKEINLLWLLPPPPALNSPAMNQELAEVLSLQVTRTPEQVARAIADVDEVVWRFSDVIGNAKFTPDNLPLVAAFFSRILETESAVVDPAKDFWKRPRPYQYSDLVRPVVPLSKSGSYPSGHATVGTLMGILLAEMLPEKRDQISSRAAEFAHNRLVGGVHFRSDIEAGRVSGTVIAQVIGSHSDFQRDFQAAKAELRGVLGL